MDPDSNSLSASRLHNAHDPRGGSFARDLSVRLVKSEVGLLSNTSTTATSSWTLRWTHRTEYSRSSNPTAQNSRQEESNARPDPSLRLHGRHRLRMRNHRCTKKGSLRTIP